MKKVILSLIAVFSFLFSFSQCENDSTNPWFENFNPEPTISCSTDLSTVVPIVQDNCDTLVDMAIAEEIMPGNCPGNYDIFRIYRAFDDNGNQVVESQLIHVVDETGPQVSGVSDLIEISCNNDYNINQPVFSDDCSDISSFDFNIETYINSNELNEFVYIWSATDGCGNVSYAQTTVRYVDSDFPWFENVPEDLTVNCGDEIPPVVYPEVFDNCDTFLPIEYTEEYIYGDCPSNYDIIRMFRAYDNSGNPVMESQVIHVVDNVAPEFTSLTTDIMTMCEYSQFNTPIVWDNCGTVNLTWQEITVDSISPCNYGRLITWTATDDCGNASYASQAIQIIDTISPIISGQIQITLPIGSSLDSVMVDYSDDCSSVTIDYQDLEVSGNNLIRTYTAIDGCGNISTFEQIIGFEDDGSNLVAICHLEGNGTYHTIWVAPQAVQAHLNHGDYLGECDEDLADNPDDNDDSDDSDDDNDDSDDDNDDNDDSDDDNDDNDDSDDDNDDSDDDNDDSDDDNVYSEKKVAICHLEGNGTYHTIWVAPQAVQAHLNHGDYLGLCNEEHITNYNNSNRREWIYRLPNSDISIRVIKSQDKYLKFLTPIK